MNKTLAACAFALITALSIIYSSPETSMNAIHSGIPLSAVA